LKNSEKKANEVLYILLLILKLLAANRCFKSNIEKSFTVSNVANYISKCSIQVT